MKKGLEPAFPTITTGRYPDLQKQYPGMSTRLYLAGMAMQGILSIPNCHSVSTIVKLALTYTDELLKQEEFSR